MTHIDSVEKDLEVRLRKATFNNEQKVTRSRKKTTEDQTQKPLPPKKKRTQKPTVLYL